MTDGEANQQILVTRAEYARRAGVSRAAVTKMVKTGRVPTYGARKLIDPDEADRRRAVNLVRVDIEDQKNPVEIGELTTRKTESEGYRSELLRLELEKRRGNLLDRTAVVDALVLAGGRIGRSIEGLLAIADQLDAAARNGGVDAVRSILKEQVRAMRERIADQLVYDPAGDAAAAENGE